MRRLLDRLLGRGPRYVRDAVNGPITHYVHKNTRQPDGYGAERYAFETLGLTSSSPIDGAVRVRRQILQPFSGPQVWVGHAVPINGIPSQTGGIYTGGMLTESGAVPDLGTWSTVDMGAVARNDPAARANSAAAVYGPNNPI